MARVEPLPPEAWPPEMTDAMAALRPAAPRHPFPSRDPGRPKGLNALGTFAHHPALTRAFNTFNGHVLFGTTLSARQRELLVLRVAARRSAAYEWAQHEFLARDAGLTDAEIAALSEAKAETEPIGGNWSPLERALLRAADELIDEATIADDTWSALAAELDTQQLLDVIFTVGAYDLVAMMFRACDVALDSDLERK